MAVSSLFILILLAPLLWADETVTHRDGDSWSFPGRADSNEYLPSGQNSLFQPGSVRREGGASGGFSQDLEITSSYGMSVRKTSPSEIEKFLQQFDKQISRNSALRQGLEKVLEDRFVFYAMNNFLENKGKFNVWPSGGHYDREHKTLSIGVACNKDSIKCIPFLAPQSTIFHELLHYVFDRYDSIIAEVETSGGADHSVIAPIEERFIIVSIIRNGEPPLHRAISGLYGYTYKGKLGNAIESHLDSGDLAALKALVESDAFLTNYVHSSLTRLLSANEYGQNNSEEGKTYTFPIEQIQDIVHLWAYNAAILQQSLRLAITMTQHPANWEITFSSPEYQAQFEQFLTTLVSKLEANPSLPLFRSSKTIMNTLLPISSEGSVR